MFHLGGSGFPTTREQLISAVTDGLRSLVALPTGKEVVRVDGSYPAFNRVAIDLSGAVASLERLPPEPRGVGQATPAVSATRLEVAAHPLWIGEGQVDLTLGADHAQFNYDRDKEGRPVLALSDAKNGKINLQISKRDLDALLLAVGRQAAAKQGAQIVESQLTLNQLDPRSVAVEVRVKAKKLFVSAAVKVSGRLAIDDALRASGSGLACSGEGMLGDMVCGALRPQLAKIDGRSFPLTALSLGQVKLRDLRLSVGDSIAVAAAFGS